MVFIYIFIILRYFILNIGHGGSAARAAPGLVAGQGWRGQAWAGLGWAGLAWPGLSWLGLELGLGLGLGWLGLILLVYNRPPHLIVPLALF